MMEKKEFIYQNAAVIYAAMFTREDKEPNPERAIELAEELWDLLEAKYQD